MTATPITELTERDVSSAPGGPWLKQSRLAAWQRFSTASLPKESEELWRYSRIDELDLGRYRYGAPGATEPAALSDLPADLQELVAAAGPSCTLLVAHDGAGATVSGLQAGAELAPADGPESGSLGEVSTGATASDPWAELNGALVEVPWRLTVDPGVTLRHPVVVVHWLRGERRAHFPRLEVELGAGASARVVEILASPDDEMLVAPVADLVVGKGANLGFGQVQVLGQHTWQLGNQVSRVGRDAVLQSMTVALGGTYARSKVGSVLAGAGGDSEILAAFFGSGDQMHDMRTVQHHAAERSRSNLVFKGAVANQARSVYSGLIRVEKGARGTNAFQTNRNLVLSEGAQAYSVPNLEIEDNDVRCSHASAVGPVDESQLFYLESRGVPAHVAERLIALGFVDDVLGRFPVGGAVGWLRSAMERKLDSAGFGVQPS